jgi:hypothetical protein
MINHHVRIYKCVQSLIVALQQHLSATPETIIRVYFKKNTINIQIIVQKHVMKLSDFSVASFLAVKYQITYIAVKIQKQRVCLCCYVKCRVKCLFHAFWYNDVCIECILTKVRGVNEIFWSIIITIIICD